MDAINGAQRAVRQHGVQEVVGSNPTTPTTSQTQAISWKQGGHLAADGSAPAFSNRRTAPDARRGTTISAGGCGTPNPPPHVSVHRSMHTCDG